jgi:hypothetical protein
MAKSNQVNFDGFDVPDQNWFRLPNSWTDITRQITSLAELKVVEYVLRHTWGYREFGIAKRISINEFMNGRRRGDGSRIDSGTGLSKPSVIEGVRSAVRDGYLVEQIDDSDRGRVKKYYVLRMRDDTSPSALDEGSEPSPSAHSDTRVKKLNADVKNLYRGVKKLDRGSKESLPRSEKDTQERNLTVTTAGNGDENRSPVGQLPRQPLEPEQNDLLVGDMLEQFRDEASLPFYRMVAEKVPESKIREIMSAIRQDDSIKHPAGVFVYRLNAWARRSLARQKKSQLDEGKRAIGKW